VASSISCVDEEGVAVDAVVGGEREEVDILLM
jgi:hypothetical protein